MYWIIASEPDIEFSPTRQPSQWCSYTPYTRPLKESAVRTHTVVQPSAWRTLIARDSRCNTPKSSASTEMNRTKNAIQMRRDMASVVNGGWRMADGERKNHRRRTKNDCPYGEEVIVSDRSQSSGIEKTRKSRADSIRHCRRPPLTSA